MRYVYSAILLYLFSVIPAFSQDFQAWRAGILAKYGEKNVTDLSDAYKFGLNSCPSTFGCLELTPSNDRALDFLFAHFHDKAEPKIFNQIKFEGSEFDFQRKAEAISKIKRAKYIIVPWHVFAEYNFAGKCLSHSIFPTDPMMSQVFAHHPFILKADFRLAYESQAGLARLSKKTCIKIPPDVAEQLLKSLGYYELKKPSETDGNFNFFEAFPMFAVVKINRAHTESPIRCNKQPPEDVLNCKAGNWEKLKFKFLDIEIVNYFLDFSGNKYIK